MLNRSAARWGRCRLYLVGLLMLGLAGCATDSRPVADPDLDDAPAPAAPLRVTGLPKLRVGVAATAPPIIYTRGSQMVGVEADCARALASALGREVRFVPMYYANLLYELGDKRIDIIMAGMTVTPQRQREAIFTDPYLTIGQMALIRAADRARLPGPAAVLTTTGRVGVENESTGAAFARTHLPNARVVIFPTLEKAADALVLGELDVVIHDSPCIQWIAQQRRSDRLLALPDRLTTEELAWALHPHDTDLRDRINAILAQWRADGTLQGILERWVPVAAR